MPKRQVLQPSNGKTLICTKCYEQKPRSGFYASKPGSGNYRTYGGYSMPCKACEVARCSARAKTPEAKQRANELRRNSPTHRAKANAARKAWFEALSEEEKEVERAKGREAYYKHHEKRRAHMKARYHAPDGVLKAQIKASTDRRRATPKGRAAYLASNAKYKKSERGRAKSVFHRAAQRSRQAGVANTLTEAEWAAILIAHDSRCAYCGIRCDKPEMEHVVPMTKGGPNAAENVVPSCVSCNRRKWAHLREPRFGPSVAAAYQP